MAMHSLLDIWLHAPAIAIMCYILVREVQLVSIIVIQYTYQFVIMACAMCPNCIVTAGTSACMV